MPKRYKRNVNKTTSLEDILMNSTELTDLKPSDLVSMTGCNIKTARRWIKKAHGISPANQKLVELEIAGHVVPESWRRDFKFVRDHVVINEGGNVFSYSDLVGYWLRIQQHQWAKADIRSKDLKIRNLEQLIQKLKSQVQETASNDSTPVVKPAV